VRSLDVSDADSVRFGAQLLMAFFFALRTEDHVNGRLLWGDIYPAEDGSLDVWFPPGKSVRVFRLASSAARDDELDLMTSSLNAIADALSHLQVEVEQAASGTTGTGIVSVC
jgi:hypothetical protein